MKQLDSPKAIRKSFPGLGILIPAYNPEPDTLHRLLRRIADLNLPELYEVVVVDDGSQKPVRLPKIPELPLTLLRQTPNRGKGAALKLGFGHLLAQPSIQLILTLDADLQHPPEKIPQFLQRFQQTGEPIVVGYRSRSPRVMPPHRIVSNSLTSLIISLLTGQLVRDSQCGFRLIHRSVLGAVSLQENRFHLESELLIRAGWRGFRIGFVPIPTIYTNEKSSIKNVRDTLNFVFLIIRLVGERLRR